MSTTEKYVCSECNIMRIVAKPVKEIPLCVLCGYGMKVDMGEIKPDYELSKREE